jgi:NTE family protein
MKADAVFEGGGVKGIGLVGAVCCMERYGYTWERLAGTSAGAIVASLLAVGYSGKELKEIMRDLNYMLFLDKNKVQSIPVVGAAAGLWRGKGIYCGNYIQEWLNGLYEAKGKTKFKHITENGVSKLTIIASDITQRNMLILPFDIKKYGIDPMELDIALAVRMSIGIPFYFCPIKLDHRNGSSYVVDGGLLSNYPIWIFDVKNAPRWPTIGFKLSRKRTSYTAMGRTDILSYLFDIIGTAVDRNEEIYLEDKDNVRTINIDTLGVKATQFSINKDESKRLFDEGYNSAAKFLRNWRFEEYKRKYRSINAV